MLGVHESEPKSTLSAVSVAHGGQRVTTNRRDSIDVTVRFGLRITMRDMQARSELAEKINGWAAAGGWLEVNYKPNRRIYVTCVKLPDIGDQYAWNSEYEIAFRAFEVPYWQASEATTLKVTRTKSAEKSIEVEGTARTVFGLEFENTSGKEISTMSVSTKASSMAFKGLSMAAGELLSIDHRANGVLRMRIKNTEGRWRSIMAKRTEDSSDDLYIDPGTQQITFAAGRVGTLTVTCFGRYL